MSPHQHPRMYKRQFDLTSSITAAGLNGETTAADSVTAGASGLAIDPTAKFTPPAAPTGTLDSTTSSSVTASPTATPTSASSNAIPIGTVVGACVGAFLGAALLIGIGFYFYRRSVPPPRDTRAFSKLDPSDKQDQEKQPEPKYPPTPKPDLPYALPTTLPKSHNEDEKLDMFQAKSVKSVHSGASDYSAEHTGYSADGHAPVMSGFSPYTPVLTNVNALNTRSTPNLNKDPQARPFQGRTDNQPPIVSWDGETVGNFSIRSNSQYDLRASSQVIDTEFKSTGGAMSPSLVLAIPTPVATSTVHRWEVAQVENFEPASNNPFARQMQEDADRTPRASLEEHRKSRSNPFFGAKDDGFSQRKRSMSAKSEISVDAEDAYLERAKEHAKGKQRARANSTSTIGSTRSSATAHGSNPFAAHNAPPVPIFGNESPRPLPSPVSQAHHSTSPSAGSVDADKAIQSLIAALDIQPVQRNSLSSEYTDASEGVNNGWAVDSPNGFRG